MGLDTPKSFCERRKGQGQAPRPALSRTPSPTLRGWAPGRLGRLIGKNACPRDHVVAKTSDSHVVQVQEAENMLSLPIALLPHSQGQSWQPSPVRACALSVVKWYESYTPSLALREIVRGA